MKAYVQYFDVDTKGNVVEALGSDGYLPLDARLSLDNMIEQAERPNFRGYKYYEIRKGDFSNYKLLWRNLNMTRRRNGIKRNTKTA